MLIVHGEVAWPILLRLRPYLIQSVDSEHLLRAIDAEAAKQGIIQDILLELHVAREETKSGLSIDEFRSLIAAIKHQTSNIGNIRLCGLMGMATNTDDEQEIRRCFRALHEQFVWLKQQAPDHSPLILSMGMSDDYPLAIEQGTTMIRLGSAVFGDKM